MQRRACYGLEACAPPTAATYHLKFGYLTCSPLFQVDAFMAEPFAGNLAAPADPLAGLLDALGVGAAGFVGRARFDWLVELADEAAVRDLAPDLRALGGLTLDGVGVIVTAAAAPGAAGHDFVSRYFAPAAGIDEDPVTGSAHCVLGPFWARRLGRDDLTGFQASARGGLVRVRPQGDRAHLGGRAVTVLRGRLV
jgi:predicted PhzF superfamily epimerase YddE/YHI9